MELREVRKLARELMDEHGLYGWTLEMSQSKSFVGRCYRLGKRIQLSEPFMLVLDFAEVQDTILHEIAHGLDDSHGKPHGDEWKAIAWRIGAKPQAKMPANTPQPDSKWTGVCSSGCEFFRDRLTQNLRDTGYCRKHTTSAKVARITWYDTAHYKRMTGTAKTEPVAAKKVVKDEVGLTWKEKFDRGMTEIDW